VSYLRLYCPHCNRSLEVREELVGQTMRCPSCRGAIEVRASSAEEALGPGGKGTKACPFCGEEVLAAARKCKHCGEIIDEDLRRQMSGPGRASQIAGQLAGPAPVGERTEYASHPAMFRSHPFGFILTLLLCVVVVGLAILLIWWLRTLGTTLTVTNKKTVLRKGLLARQISEVFHRDVRNIQVNQTMVQRLFGVGSVGISSAGQSGIEIVAEGVPNPMEVKRIVERYRLE